jgi:hypothetical protein
MILFWEEVICHWCHKSMGSENHWPQQPQQRIKPSDNTSRAGIQKDLAKWQRRDLEATGLGGDENREKERLWKSQPANYIPSSESAFGKSSPQQNSDISVENSNTYLKFERSFGNEKSHYTGPVWLLCLVLCPVSHLQSQTWVLAFWVLQGTSTDPITKVTQQ